MIRPLYTLTGIFLTPLIRLWLARRARHGKEDKARLTERFGYAAIARPHGTLIWLHAASVGEAQSVLTLVRRLLQTDATLTMLITTGTVTSAALVAKQSIPRVIHQFVPVDTYHAVKRFLNHWQPDLALWVESELWPQLLWQAAARRIPLLLINARMSAHSFANWLRWPRTIGTLLASFTTIYAGSHADAEHFRALAAPDVREAGNLKYDAEELQHDADALAVFKTQCDGRRCWLAASTHPGEEQLLSDIHHALRHQFPDLLLVLVPRHAVRGDALAHELRARGHCVSQRSKYESLTAATTLYLADTMGELGLFYRACPVTFLGGSLVAVGGHNPIEPARLNTALITGSHLHNFAAIMQQFLQQNALTIVADAPALQAALADMLANPEAQRAMASRAAACAAAARGASDSILTQVQQILNRGAA